jgi:hypothetical protein
MTKQQFLDGKSFTLPYIYSNNNTYKCGDERNTLEKEYRTKEGKVVISDYLMNIDKIGNKMVTCFTYILDTKITKKIRYEDMVEVTSA